MFISVYQVNEQTENNREHKMYGLLHITDRIHLRYWEQQQHAACINPPAYRQRFDRAVYYDGGKQAGKVENYKIKAVPTENLGYHSME